MSSRNPNSVTSVSSSPSPSPNSGENRENIVPQREEIQADETVPKEEEQSAADTADSASKEEETPKQENPDEKFPKPENPDEEMAQEEEDPDEENPEPEIPQEENPKQEIPEQVNPHEENPVGEITKPENPDEEMAQEEEDPDEENPEPEIPQEENPKQEIPEQANPHEEIPLEGEKLVANFSEIVADIQMDDHQQMFGDIVARNRQEAQIATHAQNQEQVQLLIKNWSNNLGCYGFFGVDSETLEYENAELDAIYAGNLANEPNRGSGNRGKENSTIENPQQENPHELEGDAIFSYLSNIVPDFELSIQQQITEDIEARKRQEVRVDSATLGYENVKSDAMYAENPDVNISKPENPDDKIPEEEDPKEENPDEEISKPEIPEPDAIYAGNLANEPNRGSGNRGKENSTIESPQQENPHEPEGDAIFSYLSNIVPDFELSIQQQITEDIEARKRQEVRVDSATLGYENVKSDAMYVENPDVNISKPENPDEKIPEEEDPKEENPDEKISKPEIPEPDAIYAGNLANEPNRGSGNRGKENTTIENPQQENPHELEGDALFSYLSNIVPDFELGVQQQITADIEARKRQEVRVDSAALGYENVKSDAMYAENPDVNISKPENPDEKIPEEEDPKEENPDEDIPKPEIPEPENPQQANPHELEGEALFSYLSNIVPPFELGVQQQITEGIEVRNRQEVQIANQAQNQEQVLEAAPNSFHWSDNLEDYGFISDDSETFEKDNAELDAMYAKNWANEPNRESGNRGQENPTTDSIPTFDPNRGMGSGEFNNNTIAEILAAIPTVDLTWGLGIAQPENPTIADIHREQENPSFGDMYSSTAEMFALLPPIEPNRGNGNIYPENPTNAEIFAAFPPKKRMKMLGKPTIDPTFDSRPAINPNKGFTIRETQNPPNNAAPAAVPKQQNKVKGKDRNNPAPAAVPKQEDSDEEEDENPRLTKMCKCISESCFLFPRSTSEEEDDIVTMISVSAYSRNHRPLPSAGSPEHFDTLFAFISSQLSEGESISLETLKEKFAKLVRKYLRQLRQRDMHSYFEAFASDYERDLYRLGREVWGNAYAEGYRVPPGQVGTSGTSGDSS